tara:strand:+ start:3670 stop:4137 length:468 start_codon:yes stop_codon:yes gene_type:complete
MSKKKYDSHKPVLNSYLLEGAFVGCMDQVMQSIDCCRTHEVTPEMDLPAHIRALHNISIKEMEDALLLVDERHESTLNKKHRGFVKRTRTVRDALTELETGTNSGQATVLRLVLNWIQDAHLIMHEDTDQSVRSYLSEKGLSDDTKEAKRVVGVQ